MTYTESSIRIKGDINTVFSVFADMENYPEFVPYCREARIIKEETDEIIIVEMKIKINGITNKERARVFFSKSDFCFKAEQLKGVLRQLTWIVKMKQVSSEVEVVSRHDFDLGIPVIGKLIEQLIIKKFFMEKTEKALLKAVKEKVHLQNSEKQ